MELNLHVKLPEKSIYKDLTFETLNSLNMDNLIYDYNSDIKKDFELELQNQFLIKDEDEYVARLSRKIEVQEYIKFTYSECQKIQNAIYDKTIVLNDMYTPYELDEGVIYLTSYLYTIEVNKVKGWRIQLKYMINRTKLIQSLI